MAREEITEKDVQLLRRAAGSQSVEALKTLFDESGWTAKEVDSFCEQSKTPLQQAAWKGRLDSIQYLLDVVGCDINVYSKQRFSYGKTAIFFALTQSRQDVVDCLLSYKNINVSIVNNKGQSVLSLASSHKMPIATLEKIQSLEESDKSKWWNFRATHSDGFEYGDLDPRFFQDRPLRENDVVTKYALNPTTKRTRKGGFERRNPEAAKKWQQIKQQQNQSKKKNPTSQAHDILSEDERERLHNAWKLLEEKNGSDDDFQSAIITIITLNDKFRQAWIPQTTERLTQLGYDFDKVSSFFLVPSSSESNSRVTSLLVKLLDRLNGEKASPKTSTTKKRSPKRNVIQVDWLRFSSMLKGLQISFLEHEGESNLCLGQTAVHLIQEVSVLKDFFHSLKEKVVLADDEPVLLAMDAEWYDSSKESNTHSHNDQQEAPSLSTIQFAQYDRTTQSLWIHIIDILVNDAEYQTVAQSMIRWLLDQKSSSKSTSTTRNLWILGFSFGHDIAVLERYCGNHKSSNPKHQQPQLHKHHHNDCYSHILDLQLILAPKYELLTKNKNKNQLPGLKACAQMYSNNYPLSKKEQCSDWSKRPLSNSQVEYAGLDAAILLVLLAEESRRRLE